jgi:UDP-N-acetylmuramoylalanine--D-glutamate ligase
MMESMEGLRVMVMGLGRFGGGVGVTRWLCGQGARVTVTDLASADQLTESVAKLADLPITFRLGGHEEKDLEGCDLLVVNPAVPDEAPFLVAAARRGVPITTEINLFCQRCPARLIGITGSVGKSTTAAMTAEVLARKYTTHLGGNIGRSLLEELADGTIQAGHLVVLELSSFQLERMAAIRLSPQVAVVTNLRPNHLDRHGTLEAYATAKKNIFRFQRTQDLLIINAADPAIAAWAAEAPGRVVTFALADEPFELVLPGEHNQMDAQAAWAIGKALGVSRSDAAAALRDFRGLPHRLALVAERGGVRYFDDSKATTPDSAMAALRSFEEGSVVAIVGGYDKHVPLDELCRQLAQRCKAIVATGQVGPQLAQGVRSHLEPARHGAVSLEPSFDDAVAAAVRQAAPGDVVLLSPACASYGQFTNFMERGRRFQMLVGAQA